MGGTVTWTLGWQKSMQALRTGFMANEGGMYVMRFSKKIVILIVTLNIVFAGAVLAVFWHTGSEPAALVGAWFAFTTGELWALSKVTREKHKNNKESEESK